MRENVQSIRDGRNVYTIFSLRPLSGSEASEVVRQVGSGELSTLEGPAQRYNGVEFRCFFVMLDSGWKVGP